MRLQLASSRCCLKSRRGFGEAGISLIELMVVISMLMMIAMVLVNLVSHSSAMVAKGAATIELNQRARTAVDRISPYLVTASASEDGTLAVKSPSLKVDAPNELALISYLSIQFTTTEDFLKPNYKARDPWSPTHDRYFYEIFFDDKTSPKTYVTEDGKTLTLGQIRLRRYTREFGAIDTTVSSVPLAHNVQMFRCHKLTARNLEVIVHTVGKRKGPHGAQLDSFEEARGIVNTPAPYYR